MSIDGALGLNEIPPAGWNYALSLVELLKPEKFPQTFPFPAVI
jgi:hypothetical protein